MDCYAQLLNIQNSINEKTGFSYARLDELKEQNELDIMLKSYNVDYLFEIALKNFIYLIENTNFIYHEYLRKIYMHESELVKIFSSFGYIMSLYFNNVEAYRVFPVFFKECVKHYNIERYANLSTDELEKLLSKYLDFRKVYDLNKNRNIITVNCKAPELYTDYSKIIDNMTKKGIVNCYDKNEFFVYSEYDTYERELHSLSNFNLSDPKEYVRWVSRYNGDGYGYDILSYDIKKNREKLIEVKSGLSENFSLTENEYLVLMDTLNKNYSDYYIYRYYYDTNCQIVIFKILKFNKEKQVFIDVNTNEIYNINKTFEVEDNIQKLRAYIVPEEIYKRMLKKDN